MPVSLPARAAISIFELGSFMRSFSFYGSMVEFFPKSSFSNSGSFLSLNKSFTAYLLTWLCLSIIEFNRSILLSFTIPNVSFMKLGSIPFFFEMSYNFFSTFSSTGLSSTFLKLSRSLDGLFLPPLFSALSIAAISTNYKFSCSLWSSSIASLILLLYSSSLSRSYSFFLIY